MTEAIHRNQEQELSFKEVWIPCQEKFRFSEQVDPTTGTKKFILQGMMLPFGKISRNGVLYNKDSVVEKHKDLVGRPVMYNHMIEGQHLPIGHFTNSSIKDDGWYYEADIDPAEKDFIRKLERGDLRHVSIQLVGAKAVERFDENTGRSYTEAYVGDVIEGSVVPAPGFLDTTTEFKEAFGKTKFKEFKIGDEVIVNDTGEKGRVVDVVEGEPVMLVQVNEEKIKVNKEDVTTTTASGAIQPTQDLEKDKKEAKEIIESLGKEKVDEMIEALTDNELRKFVVETTNNLRTISNNTIGSPASKVLIKGLLEKIRLEAEKVIKQL